MSETMTKESLLRVIYNRLTETVDIFRDNRKSYKGEEIELICALRYAITVCKVVKSIIDDIQNKNKQGKELIELLYLSKLILHGINGTSYYAPCRLEDGDYFIVRENFDMCIDVLDRLIKSYKEYD